ncbi:MAG: adenylate/guanylate cyclase domain-containing protein [Betaproteobacteria bacterium]|nr:adenylate/guanylate cyclase domain-containing protein [Betaproteobacteria bacterium]
MSDSGLRHRLAAILAADVVGYSRLMAQDDRATLGLLDASRGVFRARVEANQGRVVDLAGDSVLAVFETASGAVNAALEIQKALAITGEAQAEARRMRFRIGIHLGDVIEKADGTVYGDGVNIAARLEGLAEPGGITLSGMVHEAVRSRVAAQFADLGEQSVKNIGAPVRAFRVLREASDAAAAVLGPAALPLPGKPSIAVLPFTNMGGDAEHEYFADGIVEDIITELSRYSELFVIARNSTFTYKGRAVKVQDVRRDLGVHYVVEGSVRRSGNRVRLTVQLIDATTGNHVWAERYDRDFVDLFALQDELTRAIVATLPGRLGAAEAERLRRKPPSDMAAFDYLLAGKIHHHRATPEDNDEALRLLDKAIALDPQFAQAYAWKACTLGQAAERGFRDPPEKFLMLAWEEINKAVALDENDVECHRLLCEVCIETRQLDQAVVHNERALAMNPNDPRLVAQKGEVLTWLGQPAEAVEWLKTAMRLDPHGAPARAHLLGRALFGARQYAEALEAFRRIRSPRPGHLAFMAACAAQLDRDDEARERLAAALALKPDLAIKSFVAGLFYREASDREHLAAALRKAGLPE